MPQRIQLEVTEEEAAEHARVVAAEHARLLAAKEAHLQWTEARNRNRREEVPSPPDSLPPPLLPGKTTASPPSDSPRQAAEENKSGSGSNGTQTHTVNLFSWPRDNEERVTGLDTILGAFDNTIPSLKSLGMAPTKSDAEFQLTRTGRVDINTASLNDELMGRTGSDFFMTL